MPFQSAPQCAEAVINADYHGKAMANVLNFHFGASYSQADLDNLSALVDATVGTYYLPWINNSVSYVNTHVRGLTSAIDLESFNSVSAGLGTSGAVEMPANSAACLTIRTGHTGRSARGRFYAFPTSANHTLTGQTFATSYMAGIQDFLNHIVSGVVSLGCRMVVLSRFSAGSPRLIATSLDVTSIVIRNNEMDSQRGRLLSGH